MFWGSDVAVGLGYDMIWGWRVVEWFCHVLSVPSVMPTVNTVGSVVGSSLISCSSSYLGVRRWRSGNIPQGTEHEECARNMDHGWPWYPWGSLRYISCLEILIPIWHWFGCLSIKSEIITNKYIYIYTKLSQISHNSSHRVMLLGATAPCQCLLPRRATHEQRRPGQCHETRGHWRSYQPRGQIRFNMMHHNAKSTRISIII